MKYLNKYLKTHLSPMENEIFEYMLAEMTYTEIAEKTGRELKSVDNSIQRIKKKLKNFIEEYEKEQSTKIPLHSAAELCKGINTFLNYN